MKRFGDHDDRLSKRSRVDSSLSIIKEHFALPLRVEDLRAGPGPADGYLEGDIFTTSQASIFSFRAQEQESHSKPPCVDFRLEGQWARKVQLFSGDHIRLSTKGANVTFRYPSSGNSRKLPLLTYSNGVSLVVTRRAGSSVKADEGYSVWPSTPRKNASPRRPSRFENVLMTPETERSMLNGGRPESDATAVESSGDSFISRDNTPTAVASSSQPTSKMEAGDGGVCVSAPRASLPKHRSIASRSPLEHEKRSSGDPLKNLSVTSAPIGDLPQQQQHPALGPSQYRLHKMKRRQRKNEIRDDLPVASGSGPSQTPPISHGDVPIADEERTSRRRSPLRIGIQSHTMTEASSPPSLDNNTPSAAPADNIERDADGIPNVQRGLRTINGDYIPLSAIKMGKMVSVIAVVTSAREVTRTRKGDWSQSLSLIDPSNFEELGRMLYTEGAGIKLNCFSTVHATWIPTPRTGDILIARMTKVKSHQDNPSLIGYSDKLEWTIFQPDTCRFTHGDLKDAPRSTRLGGGYGAEFSPFWEGTDLEREYCLKLCEWWDAVQRARKKKMGGGGIVQIGGGEGPAEIGRQGPRKSAMREHRLICDADPNLPPNGYFNCTVEILHGQSLSPGMYTVWVTDYTAKEGAPEVITEWCPANLSSKVFRVELWEGAVDLGPKMKSGEFWSIGNMRMKTDSRGFYEGSFSEFRKAHRLEPEEAEHNPYLQALFERKEAWEESNVSPNEFPHKTFAEVTLSEIFDCTVEVLHTEPNPDGTSRIYVSDYTERVDLARSPRAARVERMDNSIVTIELRDGQSEMAGMMEPGSFFRVSHLRLQKRYTGDGKVVGQLGGHDRLINKVSKNAKDPALVSLLHRKEAWLFEVDTPPPDRKPRPTKTKMKTTSTKRRPGYSNIKDILSSGLRPGSFRLHARVTDFFPMSLQDCIVRSCQSCGNELTPSLRKCPACGVSEHRYVFRLFFCLEDDSCEDSLQVHVDGRWAELAGLSPEQLAGQEDPTHILLDRLGSSIGNLVEVHNSLGEVQVETSARDFTIASWVVPTDAPGEDSEMAYGLR